MFRGEVLGVVYYSWLAYKKAWNEAVLAGKLFDSKDKRIIYTY